LDSFEQLKLEDEQAQEFYDKVKIYPKTNQEQAKSKVSRDNHKERTFHPLDNFHND
jgi:hypothetical protein